jgi:hypothetical protein
MISVASISQRGTAYELQLLNIIHDNPNDIEYNMLCVWT